MPTPITSPRSVLVYTDGEVVGDGILGLTFAASLKHALPNLHLTWLSYSHSTYQTTLAEMAAPLIDRHIVLPAINPPPLSEYVRRPAALRRDRFDLILDTQRRVNRTLWLKRIRHRHFISAAADGKLSTIRPHNLSPHYFTRLTQMAELGLDTTFTRQPLHLPSPEWHQKAATLLPDGPRYIGFIVGAGEECKRWPLENFITTAQHITTMGYTPVILLGPKETALQSELKTALPTALFPLSGEPSSPYVTIALAHRLTAALANDSGGAHLLAAGGTPLVTLFRSTRVHQKYLPLSAHTTGLNPETFNGTTTADIPVDAVLTAVQKLLR